MTNLEIEETYLYSSPEDAFRILLPLANAGNSHAQFYLGHLCDGQTPRDQAAALVWYKSASDSGHAEAMHYLASFIYFGYGAKSDIDEALILFRRAADSGLDISQWKLGQHLMQFPSTRLEGIEWLRRAAAQGHEAAAELLLSEKL